MRSKLLYVAIVLLSLNIGFMLYRNFVIKSQFENRVSWMKTKIIEIEKKQEFLKGKYSEVSRNANSREKYELESELQNLKNSLDEVNSSLENFEYYEWYE